MDELIKQIAQMPLIAILRGITPDEASGVSDILVASGFQFIEVTTNSPDWDQSLHIMHQRHGHNIILGAGTVLMPEDVENTHAAGGRAIISPNCCPAVIQRTKDLGMLSIPGCYTPTECFTALDAGADILKIFPADTLGPGFIKAISAVLPDGTRLCPTGGVTLENMAEYFAVGVYAIGIGSALYKTGRSLEDITTAANNHHAAWISQNSLTKDKQSL